MSKIFQPLDPKAKLWRYLNTDPKRDHGIDKFKSLLETQALYMSKASGLPDTNEVRLPECLRAYRESWLKLHTGKYDEQQWNEIDEETRNSIYVNCWNSNDFELIRMWDEYCGSNEGILVRTTFGALDEACSNVGAQKYFIGKVQYAERDCLYYPLSNVYYSAMHKEGSKFGWENEVRIAISSNPQLDHEELPLKIEEVIDAIYVHPLASVTYFDSVATLIQKSVPTALDRLSWSHLLGHVSVQDFVISNPSM